MTCGVIDAVRLGRQVEEIIVNRSRVYRIGGDPHTLYFIDSRGPLQLKSTWLAANMLVWQDGSLTLSLESALEREAALGIAVSIRSPALVRS